MSRFDLILENKDDFVKFMVLENGKFFVEVNGEVVVIIIWSSFRLLVLVILLL